MISITTLFQYSTGYKLQGTSSLNSRAGYSNDTTDLATKNSYNNHKKGS